MPVCTVGFDTFRLLLIMFCRVFFIKNYLWVKSFSNKIIDVSLSSIILRIMNLCFPSGVFTTFCKSAIIFHLLKDLDPGILKNYRPVANLYFI